MAFRDGLRRLVGSSAKTMVRWLGEGDPDRVSEAFRDGSEGWDRAHSNEAALWAADAPAVQALNGQASALRTKDPQGAFHLYREAAEASSPWGMEMAAWHYDWGRAVAADFEQAQDYYRRAIAKGSQMATLRYARMLARNGRFEACEAILEKEIGAGFTPAFYWLAWLRYEHARSRKTCRAIRPLLDHAADKGHPGAKLMLAMLMMRGKFGFREILAGFRRAEQVGAEAEGSAEKPVECAVG